MSSKVAFPPSRAPDPDGLGGGPGKKRRISKAWPEIATHWASRPPDDALQRDLFAGTFLLLKFPAFHRPKMPSPRWTGGSRSPAASLPTSPCGLCAARAGVVEDQRILTYMGR